MWNKSRTIFGGFCVLAAVAVMCLGAILGEKRLEKTLYVCPIFARQNPPEIFPPNAEHRRNFSKMTALRLMAAKFSDPDNLPLGQLSHSVIRAERWLNPHASFLNHVPSVVLCASKPKMVWIYTGAIVAMMQNHKPVRDGSKVDFPTKSVDPEVTILATHVTISVITLGAGPIPAMICFVNSLPESLNYCS